MARPYSPADIRKMNNPIASGPMTAADKMDTKQAATNTILKTVTTIIATPMKAIYPTPN